MIEFNFNPKPAKVITDWNEYKIVSDRNARQLEVNGFEARLINFVLAGEALEFHNNLHALKGTSKSNNDRPIFQSGNDRR